MRGGSLYEYDINLESFTKFEFNTGMSAKLLIAGNSRVYLIEAWMSLWESEYDNEYVWNQIGEYDGELSRAQPYRVIYYL
ncbi:unnamed protein product [Blepharisma stoltei]|uniref:Uncharacterized protein n=1 Tax=Blepharisma stoltei TaxID=1481888 RepID=A0AAU9IAY2_9CILI|nr:unnamed protein product [Blepharisma stoltei]